MGFLLVELILTSLVFPTSSIEILNLVDIPLVVCSGGPGVAEIIIPPPNQSGSRYLLAGDGACSAEVDSYISPLPSQRADSMMTMTCEELCDSSSLCGAYEFCQGRLCGEACRLLSSAHQPYNVTRTSASRFARSACYVKQVPDMNKFHIPTFFRTSDKATSLSFRVTDSSPTPKVVIENTNVTLADISARRLQELQGTSAPARRGKGGGGGHGGHGGAGHSHGSSHGISSSHSAAHTTGGHTVTGEKAAGGFSSPKSSHPRASYGYRSRDIAYVYPAGYRTTPYGYTGRSAFVTSSLLSVRASLAGTAFFFSRFNTLCHCRPGATCCTSDLGRLANVSEVVDVNVTGELWRDDLMTSGFVPSNYTYPLRLSITSLAGGDYDPDSICPQNGSGSWTHSKPQDLFFLLTELEDIRPPEEEGWQMLPSSKSGQVAMFVVFAAVLVLAVFACECQRPSSSQPKSSTGIEMPARSDRKSYEPVLVTPVS